jgi:hypothetical protein
MLYVTEFRPDEGSSWRRGTVLTVQEIQRLNAIAGFFQVRVQRGVNLLVGTPARGPEASDAARS